MTLYSIVPEDQVLAGLDDMKSVTQHIEMNGITMEVEPLNAQQAKIVRIYSSNVQDYLNPNHTPGQIINFLPTVQ